MIRRGQGVVESVFAVGILGLMLTGSVILILMGVNNRKVGFDRRKATELATLVTEELVAQSRSKPDDFWKLTKIGESKKDGFDGYTYLVNFTNITNNDDYPGCGIGVTDCAEVTIQVNWQGKEAQSLEFNRFFTKKL